ncbi:hypothetical protein MAH1_19770 [Sessilibacter sp. MAH1]
MNKTAAILFLRSFVLLTASFGLLNTSNAAVLPEDRADILYHSYDGGGVKIDGPSILVRKNIADKVSVYGNYYVDEVTGASIDVMTFGSPYTEEREEFSVGADYLYDKTIMSFGYTNSNENDFEAETYNIGFSQDFFGDLSTLSIGFTYGENTIGRTGDPEFEEFSDSKRFRIGLTQVITKNFLLSLNAETVTDQGFLNNPYRQVRFLTGDGTTASSRSELYPNTRNSDAFSVKGIYYLPYRASLRADYRTYSDSFGVEAENYEIRYVHPLKSVQGLILEARVRTNDQTQADFYSDLLPFDGATNFFARDKELSTFTSIQFGFGISYELKAKWLSAFDKTTINLQYDRIEFDYDNFRDLTANQNGEFAIGEEPLYSFEADVVRLYLSFWY